jgi:hypothetical protein
MGPPVVPEAAAESKDADTVADYKMSVDILTALRGRRSVCRIMIAVDI